ncbi:hypothetical protein GCM10023350_24450 [Nocardioides endophyticus]|uniref:Carboxypeptidase regulatory-like domain-containing protein n=1 Tax=Nocardioides endophyticus TaxID=1353775 RepID=A0ABP8YUX7_9ACTN
MRHLRTLLATLLATALVAAMTASLPAAQATLAPGSISGTVVVPPGYDPRDVQVGITHAGAPFQRLATAWADVDGHFLLPDVPVGDYHVFFGTYERDLNVWQGQPAWWTSPGVVTGTCCADAGLSSTGIVTVESSTDHDLGSSPLLTHLPIHSVSGTLIPPPGHQSTGTEVELWYFSDGAYNRWGGWNRVPGIPSHVVGPDGAYSFDVLRGYWTFESYALRVVDPSHTYAFSFANGGIDASTPGTSGDFGAGAAGLIRVPATNTDVELGSHQLKLPIDGTGTVAIAGTMPGDPTRAEWGRTLTAVTDVTWDKPSVSTGFQWYRNGQAVDGATAATYDLDTIEDGFETQFSVRAVPTGHWAVEVPIESASVTVENTTPFNRVLPPVAGDAVVGRALLASPGRWTPTLTKPDGTSAYTHTYQWFRGDSPITGATNRLYVATAADFGARLQVRVTADYLNVDGSEFAAPAAVFSAATAAVRAPAALGLKVSKAKRPRRAPQPRTTIAVTARVLGSPSAGRVRILDGWKVLRTLQLKKGRASVTLRLGKGRHVLTAVYVPTALVFHGSSPTRIWKVRR